MELASDKLPTSPPPYTQPPWRRTTARATRSVDGLLGTLRRTHAYSGDLYGKIVVPSRARARPRQTDGHNFLARSRRSGAAQLRDDFPSDVRRYLLGRAEQAPTGSYSRRPPFRRTSITTNVQLPSYQGAGRCRN